MDWLSESDTLSGTSIASISQFYALTTHGTTCT